MMEHKELKSSSIESVGYSEEESILQVKFMSGAIYQYTGVSKEVAEAFFKSDSPGYYFQSFIRPCFPCERVHANGCGKYLECKVVNCACFCHAQRKDVSNAKIPNPDLAKDLRKSIKQAKAKKRK